jgi:antitoxin ParD1/3/4
MGMVKKSISVTEQQEQWIKAKIISGDFGNESEVFRDLIRERQAKEQESPEEIKAIRKALIEGEKSGFSEKTIDEIWNEARQQQKSHA